MIGLLLRCALLAAGLMAACAGAAAQPAPTWNPLDWNPKPIVGDFILPLPCGGSMAFRMVGTGGPRAAAKRMYLDDRQVLLGGADDEVPASGYLRTDFVAGPFEDKTNARYYLLGKYEVTNQQYDAVMTAGPCAAAKSERPALPKAGVSWFDAVEFTRRLNLWLYENRLEALPKASGKPGFVRLPTEAEWEFAARGGLAVGDAERGNRTFVPSNAELSDYAWYGGPSSSAGQPQSIGALKPNPLGLFDMLGNIEEIVLDEFRLNRVGRLHGQPGGMVVRGGSFRTPREAVRNSSRTELPLFDPVGRKETRLPQVGFRVALGATAFSDLAQADALQREWNTLRSSSSAAAGVNPLQVLERLLKEVTNPEQRQQLRDAIAQIGQDSRLRSELEARAIRGLWAHAVTVRWNVIASAAQLDSWKKVADEPDTSVTSATRKSVARERMTSEQARFDGFLSTYLDLVIQLATGFENRDIASPAALLRRELELLGDRTQVEQLDETVKIVTAYQRNARMRDTKVLRRAIVGERAWLPR